MSSVAHYDVILLLSERWKVTGAIGRAEVGVLAYLASLLALYAGQPLATWGYTFVVRDGGTPFSHDLSSAIESALESSLLKMSEESLEPTPALEPERIELGSLAQCARRNPYLLGAVSAAAQLPMGVIRSAIASESFVTNAARAPSTRLIEESDRTEDVYSQFKVISEVIGDGADLVVPAVAWLRVLLAAEAQLFKDA